MLFILTRCVISWYNTHVVRIKAVLSSFLGIVPTSDLFLARFVLEMGFLLKGVGMEDEYKMELPKPNIWRWDVFGNKESLLTVKLPFEVPVWRRIITFILLGSKWERLNETTKIQK